MTHRLTLALAAIALALAAAPLAASDGPAPAARLFALELGVPDVAKAADFYAAALGFELVDADAHGAWRLLGNGEARLALAASKAPAADAASARAYPNFTVSALETATEAIVAAGGRVAEAFETPVGMAATYTDPFGHQGNLIDHPWDDETRASDAAPEVFNVALNVRAVEDSEAFYTALGFTVRTRDYLPQTLVFEPLGTAQLILHPYAESPATDAVAAGALLLDADPDRALAALGPATGRRVPASLPATSGTIEVRDPSGIPLRLAVRPGTATAPAPSTVRASAGGG